MNAPDLPDTARALLKGFVALLVNVGLIWQADADRLIELLGLADA